MNALLGGQVDYICNAIPDAVQQVQSGAVKGYAISIAQRSPTLPNVPTAKEAGLPEFQA
jgi:tripartite-type tricarboxylate transporter receptor subunit TctC